MSCCCIIDQAEDGAATTTNVTLRFLRSELLYDISNYAWVQSHVMDEDEQHARHVVAEIAEQGNVDRASRILAAVHAAAVEMLYPYTRTQPVEEEIDDMLSEPDSYLIQMAVPATMSRTTINLLVQLIHEFMVCRVLADWLSLAGLDDPAARWDAKAQAAADEIGRTKNRRSAAFTRPSSPF